MSKFKGFTTVELRKPTRSTFDLSHEKAVSSRLGRLTPIFISETMPNDTFYGSSEILVKVAPLVAPIFHRINLYVHYFFVPNRLLWKDWETFITGGRLGEAVTTPPVPPRIVVADALVAEPTLFQSGSIADYLGIPPIDAGDGPSWNLISLDAMPAAAFYRCWYDYYRDRNYVADNTVLPLASGTNTSYTLWTKKTRCWEHDYFTSAALTTQRGAEVLMPLQGTGTVTYIDQSLVRAPGGGDPATGDIANDSANFLVDSAANAIRIENIEEVNLVSSDVSINDLRRAVRLQEWLERNMLAGSRYNESIMAHFGRKTSDARLQRAEYLGGGKAVIQISEVLTTAFSEDDSAEIVPPGNMAGRGSTYANTNHFSYNCEEHGFVIGIMSAMPTSRYMQGIPRMFQNRNTFLEYPWPTFAHLGEQEVYDYEIYVDVANPGGNGLDPLGNREDNPQFGYQSRYSDWKNIPSSVHGDFRSSLDFWHLARKFDSVPNLSEEFVTFEDQLQDRVFAVSGVDTLWCYIYNKINVKRSLPYFGTPML